MVECVGFLNRRPQSVYLGPLCRRNPGKISGVVQVRVATPEFVASWQRRPKRLRIKALGRGTRPDSLAEVATLVGVDLNDAMILARAPAEVVVGH